MTFWIPHSASGGRNDISILIGDTRRNKFYIPLAYSVMERFLRTGFVLKEDIIKVQHNCKATGFWVKKSKEYNFLLIMHEHVFVFQKKSVQIGNI